MKLLPKQLPCIQLIFLCGMITLNSCHFDEQHLNSNSEKLTVKTDKDIYHNERIYISINNKAGESIYLLMYNSAFRERKGVNQWSLVTTSLVEDPQKDTVIININETTDLDIFVVKPGIYRVGIPFLWDGDPGRKDTVYSNEFEVY